MVTLNMVALPNSSQSAMATHEVFNAPHSPVSGVHSQSFHATIAFQLRNIPCQQMALLHDPVSSFIREFFSGGSSTNVFNSKITGIDREKNIQDWTFSCMATKHSLNKEHVAHAYL